MQKQVNYIISYDLGFDKENILYVKKHSSFDRNFNALVGEFIDEPTIIEITRKDVLTTEEQQIVPVVKLPSEAQLQFQMEICHVSPNYFEVFGMKLIDGENPFINESSTSDIVINESALRLLEIEQPVGEKLLISGIHRTIRGVVKDAHTKSLHQKVAPQVYMRLHDNSVGNIVFFKITGNPQKAINVIEQKWKQRVIDYPFEYHFLNDIYKQLYHSEMNLGMVFIFAMLITFIISIAGLFGMAYYATQRRIRELALRKIHGASVMDIFVLLNKDFFLLVFVSFVIACPVAYYGLQKWLSGFAVKTSLNIWVFVLVGFIVVMITLLTTCYQTWKVATQNPVNALKKE